MIRLLTKTDLPYFKELLAVFGEAFDQPQTYTAAIPDDGYLAGLLENKILALAALREGRVVGGLVAYVLEKFEQLRKEIYIYDLAVAHAFRRQGIATKLIRRLQQLARESGAYVIFVQADPGDLPAIKLYESLGRREDVHHFDIPVAD